MLSQNGSRPNRVGSRFPRCRTDPPSPPPVRNGSLTRFRRVPRWHGCSAYRRFGLCHPGGDGRSGVLVRDLVLDRSPAACLAHLSRTDHGALGLRLSRHHSSREHHHRTGHGCRRPSRCTTRGSCLLFDRALAAVVHTLPLRTQASMAVSWNSQRRQHRDRHLARRPKAAVPISRRARPKTQSGRVNPTLTPAADGAERWDRSCTLRGAQRATRRLGLNRSDSDICIF